MVSICFARLIWGKGNKDKKKKHLPSSNTRSMDKQGDDRCTETPIREDQGDICDVPAIPSTARGFVRLFVRLFSPLKLVWRMQ